MSEHSTRQYSGVTEYRVLVIAIPFLMRKLGIKEIDISVEELHDADGFVYWYDPSRRVVCFRIEQQA